MSLPPFMISNDYKSTKEIYKRNLEFLIQFNEHEKYLNYLNISYEKLTQQEREKIKRDNEYIDRLLIKLNNELNLIDISLGHFFRHSK